MKNVMTIAMLAHNIALLAAQISGMSSPVSMTECDCETIRDMQKRMADKCLEMATLIAGMEDPQPINLYAASFNDQLEAMRKKLHEGSV